MNRKHSVVFLYLLFLIKVAGAQKISDTIFFNNQWRICEKPLAAYYRIGSIKIDSLWKYVGSFKDYSLEGIVQNEGGYTEEGNRDVRFTYYDSEGKLVATGNYKHGKPSGDWEWKYTDGSSHAIIHFFESEGDFRFVFYRDAYGKILLENGTGSFAWTTNAFDNTSSNCYVYGSFVDGKRAGEWKYYNSTEQKSKYLLCEERYSGQGELKKSKRYGYYSGSFHSKCFQYQFIPLTIRTAERFAYDDFFTRGPDSSAEMNLLTHIAAKNNVTN